MLRFRSLGSGSGGNATLIEAAEGHGRVTRLLVDCGFTLRHLKARLARAGLGTGDLDAVFVTHEHGDHIGCAHALSLSEGLAVHMSQGSWLASGGHDYQGRLNLVHDGMALTVGGLSLSPFTVPHDAREPLQLVCTDGDRRLGVLTDLGHATSHVMDQLQGLHALVLEFNHCPDLLARSSYPPFLKQRVGGKWGHLSNPAAAEIARAVHHPGLRHVLAAHLSAQNNRPDIVRTLMAQALGAAEHEMLTASAGEGSDWLDV